MQPLLLPITCRRRHMRSWQVPACALAISSTPVVAKQSCNTDGGTEVSSALALPDIFDLVPALHLAFNGELIVPRMVKMPLPFMPDRNEYSFVLCTPLGIKTDDDGQEVRILEVDGGSVAGWNFWKKVSGRDVRAGDRIISVNGAKEYKEIKEIGRAHV
eukprot:TRINITY_DN45799_c0_g1_i1.p2 TRINITY_DN45799_c0_g1~~TRINITY_DN45799_c0_g1_i1.p2  ORF type:complete len:159 (+),score=22.54 TRINITY_DN45799_c0_g1_i1:104-580(+)